MFRLIALAGSGLACFAMIATMTVAGTPAAVAQTATFYTVTYVEVGPVLAKVGAAALKTYREGARKDAGAVSLEVLQRIDRPNQFVVLGSWTNQLAFDAHAAGDHVKKLNEKLATTLAAPNDTRQHNGLAVAPAKSGGKDPIYAVTHVDVIPPQKDNGVAAVKQLAEDSRKHANNLSFDVWQQTNRPNHFTVVESWGNRGSFDLHEMQKETREFRTKLATMTGALYDERLYKLLK
ncbi:MAG TPA: antibiotic biosynthesis monooxygenase [Xanthobacteraceae bacterium]|jgi:quinol monooxygenase YgiN